MLCAALKMITRHAKLLFLLLIVLVTLLFFVHAPNGGFQSKNGPTTPINNLRFLFVSLLLLLASLCSSEFLAGSPLARLARLFTGAPDPSFTLNRSTSLRC